MGSKEKLERAHKKYEQKNQEYQEWVEEEEKLAKELEAKKRALMASYEKKKRLAKEKGKRIKAQMAKALAPMRELNVLRLMELYPDFGVIPVTVGAVRTLSAYNKVSKELAGDRELRISTEEMENLLRDFIRGKVENGEFLETNQEITDKEAERESVKDDNHIDVSVDDCLGDVNGKEEDSKDNEPYDYNSSIPTEPTEESIKLKDGEIVDIKTVGEEEQENRIATRNDEVFDLQVHQEERPKFENLGYVPRPFER